MERYKERVGQIETSMKDDWEDGFERHSFTVRHSEKGRLDALLAEKLSGAYSREYLKELINDGFVTVDSAPSKPSRSLKEGEFVELVVPPPKIPEVLPEQMPLKVHYEDRDLLVVVKKRGILTHPLGRQQSGTLVNALLYHCGDTLSGVAGSLRPGIVHRLDRVTSGLLVVAKSSRAHYALQDMFRMRELDKRYLAIVEGSPSDARGLIDAPIARNRRERNTFEVDVNGRSSQTSYRVLSSFGTHSLLELCLHTGRTHQIRVHLRFIGHPIVGDSQYGGRDEVCIPDGIALHAWKLEFRHPLSGEELAYRESLPSDMIACLERIKNT